MKRPEDNLQMHIVGFIRAKLPHALVFAIPNGAKRTAKEAWMMKATGMLPGMPDLGITIENGLTYYIEVKTRRGTLNPNQKDRKRDMERLNVPYAIARSLKDAEAALIEWKLIDGRQDTKGGCSNLETVESENAGAT